MVGDAGVGDVVWATVPPKWSSPETGSAKRLIDDVGGGADAHLVGHWDVHPAGTKVPLRLSNHRKCDLRHTGVSGLTRAHRVVKTAAAPQARVYGRKHEPVNGHGEHEHNKNGRDHLREITRVPRARNDVTNARAGQRPRKDLAGHQTPERDRPPELRRGDDAGEGSREYNPAHKRCPA